jgi:sodium transport system permease protein
MIFTIFKKELIDTLRDRRTVLMMIVIPVLIFPIILNIFMTISHSFQEEAANKPVKIGVIGTKEDYLSVQLSKLPELLGKQEVIYYEDSTQLANDLKIDSIQFGVLQPKNFEADLKAMNPTSLNILYNGTDVGMQERAEKYIDFIKNSEQNKRYNELKIDILKINPFQANYTNIASQKEMIGKLAGGILPYIFIAFGFIGCMYPAIDLFTGEKERGTIETLLTTPVARWKILTGKMGVVVLSGLLAATSALLGLYMSIEVFHLVEDSQLLEIIHSILSPTFILLLFALLLPLTIFFAGVMIPIAIYAKTFKEAQSMITPLNIIMVLPAMIGFFPGIELNAKTAAIPVVNIVLATKELIAGTLPIGLLSISFGIMVLLALVAVFISYRQFDNEKNMIL